MKPAILLALSLAINAALLAALVARPSLAPRALRTVFTSAAPAAPASSLSKSSSKSSNVAAATSASTSVAAAGNLDASSNLWAAMDTDDLPALVARLRAAGFSRGVVLAILSAKIEARFADRVKALTTALEDTPFWKSDAMSSVFGMPKFWEDYSQISRERSRMLRDLLGRDSMAWGNTDPSVAQRRQFGDLPQHKVDLVRRIVDDYSEMTSQLRSSLQGITLPEDREKFALLEREKRADLAAVLTPTELEEYEMRTSPVTSRLRNTLTIMDGTEAEFRAIFKIQQAANDRTNPILSGIISSQMMEERREAVRQVNEQIKSVLSPGRYEEYLRASNSEFQQLHRIAQRDNVPMETAIRAFNVRDTTAAESVRIAENPALTFEQKREALKSLAQTARTQLLGTLGPTAGEAYTQLAARWITAVERGSSITFRADGSWHAGGISPSTPPAKK